MSLPEQLFRHASVPKSSTLCGLMVTTISAVSLTHRTKGFLPLDYTFCDVLKGHKRLRPAKVGPSGPEKQQTDFILNMWIV